MDIPPSSENPGSQFGPPVVPAGELAPAHLLYSVGAVTLATFLGTPVAGSVVMAMNYRRLGNRRAARMSIVLGVIGTIALIGLAMVLPDSVPSVALSLPPLFAMQALANSLQGNDIKSHTLRGGQMASLWKAAGIGATGLVVFGGIFLGLFLWFGQLGAKINVTRVEEIYYSKQATRSDAEKLGEVLKSIGFIDGKTEKSLALRITPEGTTVSFVVSEWNDPELIAVFQSTGKQIATAGFAKPVRILLCDSYMISKREIKID